MIQTSLVATLTKLPDPSGAELAALPRCVEWLEVRSDLVGDLNPDWLRNHFRGRLQYSLRSRAEGGECADSMSARHGRMAMAARHYDRIEVESGGDFLPEVLSKVPVEKRLVSWHGKTNHISELKRRFSQLSSVPASQYRMVNTAARISDELTPLLLLKSLGRTDTIAYSTGPLGFWTRLLALHLGAPAIFGLVPQGSIVETEPTINKLIVDYGLPELTPAKVLFAIIGNPVFHSLSPRLHNASYRAMNYPALFVPLRVESFDEFWREIVASNALASLGLQIAGMTVASPHKEAALLKAKTISPMSRQAESTNILVKKNGWWEADTTDPHVIFSGSHERDIQVRHKRAAVIGCGGAGRAIAAALIQAGAGVTLVNRGAERGNHAADLLGLPYVPLADFVADGFDIVVNATPVGRDSDDVPFNVARLSDEAVVIDLVYGSKPTTLVDSSLAREHVVIDGRDVLVTQVRRQFRMMTGKEMPTSPALDLMGSRTPVAPVNPCSRLCPE
ncbi:MAG TPA: type I 3-dehydroquinate dehydratase [Pyrinomonadaceae bacterium]|nr:type I 3-dehydroquinate dehydratase [Pyrinomonadaceae bacterium]